MINKQFSFILIILTSSIAIKAQNWVNGGNALTANGTVGTTTNYSILFKTNNLERGRITNTGLWGFGTTTPNAKVQVNGATGQDPFKVQINGSTRLMVHSGGGLSVGIAAAPPANGMYVSGNAGVGIATPQNKLHVFKGSSGVAGYYDAPLVVENSTHSYVNILAPDDRETGILFGRPNAGAAGGNVDGGIIYNSAATLKGLQFRTNGNMAQMILSDKGRLGIGTAFPENYKLRLRLADDESGMCIERISYAAKWVITPAPSLFLLCNDRSVGRFDQVTGAYSTLSDVRQKTNIKPMPDILEKIRQLKPSVYQFKNANNSMEHNGFIAQEVMKLFPSIVSHNVHPEQNIDAYLMDYSQFGVLAIKGIQELETVIDEQDKRITEKENDYNARITQLEKQVAILEARLNKIIETKNFTTDVRNNASLEQNKPNPVSDYATIGYTLPPGSKGEIIIYNQQAVVVKTILANKSGQSVVNVKDMAPGIYTYSLMINGKSILAKQMLVAR